MSRWSDTGYWLSFVGIMMMTAFAWICLSGCGIPVHSAAVPTSEQVRWSREITDRVNLHDDQLRAIELRLKMLEEAKEAEDVI